MVTPERLSIRDSITMGNCEVFTKDQKVSSSVSSFRQNCEKTYKFLPLAEFDVVFMRANPPLDPFVLNFLDSNIWISGNIKILPILEPTTFPIWI